MGSVRSRFFCALYLFVGASASDAANTPPSAPVPVDRAIASIAVRYPGARIEASASRWEGQAPPDRAKWVASPRLLRESKPGEMLFEVLDERTVIPYRFSLEYRALIKTPVAIRRVRPRERLDPSMFQVREVDVARGQAREVRGLALPASQSFAGLEAIHTVLEGNFPLLSGVRKVHAIQRGEPVRIHVIAGGIRLQAAGTAEESAYVGDTIRVISSKTKRELVGKLRAESVVEVER